MFTVTSQKFEQVINLQWVCENAANITANNVDPDQTAPRGAV